MKKIVKLPNKKKMCNEIKFLPSKRMEVIKNVQFVCASSFHAEGIYLNIFYKKII